MVGNLDGQYRRDGPLGDRSLPRKLFGLHPRVPPQTQPRLNTSEVGRFLRKRHVDEQDGDTSLSMVGNLDGQYRRAGQLGDRSLPRKLFGLHRSEIGPYLGSHWATSHGPSINSASPEHLRCNGLHRIRLQSPDVDDPQGITNSSGDYDSQIHDLARIQREVSGQRNQNWKSIFSRATPRATAYRQAGSSGQERRRNGF